MAERKLRYLVLVAFGAVLTLAIVACGGSSNKKSSADTPSAGGAAPPDQQMLVAQSAEPEFFDPHRSNFEQDIAIERMLFRGLYQLELDDNDNVVAVPAMAEGEPQINGNVYTIKLKSGLKWSDGQPLTAKDFEYSLKRECSCRHGSPYQYVLGAGMLDLVGCDDFFNGKGTADAVGVKAIDDTTLQMTLKAPKPTFTTIMSLVGHLPCPAGHRREVRRQVDGPREHCRQRPLHPDRVRGEGPRDAGAEPELGAGSEAATSEDDRQVHRRPGSGVPRLPDR